MQNAIGWHVWLRCSDWEATEVLAFHLAEVLTAVMSSQIVTNMGTSSSGQTGTGGRDRAELLGEP